MLDRATEGARSATGDIPTRLRALCREAAAIVDAARPIHPRDWQIAAKNLAVGLATRRLSPDQRRFLERRLVRKLMAELARIDAEEERRSRRRSFAVFR